jgi:hypothetical protein
MSTHSTRATGRHPNPARFKRERFSVAHITFEVCNHPEHGKTFALKAGEGPELDDRRPLFTGFVEKGMAAQLRQLANRVSEMEDDLG